MPLERSGVPPEGGWADCLVGRWGHQGRGPGRWAVSYLKRVFRFVCVLFFERKWVFLSRLWTLMTVLDRYTMK
jgi:hypothetical protein